MWTAVSAIEGGEEEVDGRVKVRDGKVGPKRGVGEGGDLARWASRAPGYH